MRFSHSPSGPVINTLETAWLLVALLVPLWVNLWARQPFDGSKALLLRSLVWIIAGIWLADTLLAGRLRSDLRDTPLVLPVTCLGIVYVTATLFAEDRALSLLGSHDRGQGLLTLLSYLLLFLIVSTRVRTWERAGRLVGTMVLSATPIVVLGLLQALGWDPLGLVTDARSPIYATLGRANFVGGYLAMLLPLSVWLTLSTRDKWVRRGTIVLIVGELVVIALTLSRAAWLAAGAGLALFVLLWIWPTLSRRRQVIVGILTGLLTLTVGVGILALVYRADAGSLAARAAIWDATRTLVRARPLLGYGPDSLELIFPRVYPPELVYYQGRGLLVDRAHSVLLDTIVTSGVLGLLVWLAVLAGAVRIGWRAIQRIERSERRLLIGAALAAIAGNVAGTLISFDVTATATATWLLLGLIAALAFPLETRVPSTYSALWRRATAVLIIVAAVAAVGLVQGRLLLADIAARSAQLNLDRGAVTTAVKAGERAVRLAPHEPTYYRMLSGIYLRQAQHNTDPRPLLRQAETTLLHAIDLRPTEVRTWQTLGEFYGVWAIHVDARKVSAAYDAYRRAAMLAPTTARIYAGWGHVAYQAGDLDTAATQFHHAIDLDATDSRSLASLGDVELARGRPASAATAYEEAVYWEPDLAHAYRGLARAYRALGRHDAAENAVRRAAALE